MIVDDDVNIVMTHYNTFMKRSVKFDSFTRYRSQTDSLITRDSLLYIVSGIKATASNGHPCCDSLDLGLGTGRWQAGPCNLSTPRRTAPSRESGQPTLNSPLMLCNLRRHCTHFGIASLPRVIVYTTLLSISISK